MIQGGNKKKKVDITKSSVIELMQETYNEIMDEKSRALTAYKKFSKDINENTDIALVGKITNELLKIIDSAIEKKLRLIKLQSDILAKGSNKSEDEEKVEVPDEEMVAWIREQSGAPPLNKTKEYE